MMKGNRKIKRIIQRVVNTLKKAYFPEQVILFGSYAEGTAHRNSDIDLLIVKETKQPFFQRLVEVRRLVSDERRGYAFDPIVMTPRELQRRLARGDQFFKTIVSNGKVLYAHK
jgi:predicted nucleotidyltransferase